MKPQKVTNDVGTIVTWERFKETVSYLKLKYHMANGTIYIMKPKELNLGEALYDSKSIDNLTLFLEGYSKK